MKKVPKGKIVYIGARRFVEGELLPPFVLAEIEETETKKETKSENDKPKIPN